MSIKIHRQLDAELNHPPLAYFQKEYLSSQQYSQLRIAEDDNYFFPFCLEDKLAISIPRSPFGSIYLKTPHEENLHFQHFHSELNKSLREINIEKLQIHHPSAIYSNFIDSSYLSEYKTLYSDINQHITLDHSWESRLHKMQVRKLDSLRSEGFEFRPIPLSELETAHQFLTVCRQAQGLQLNISWNLLSELTKKMPTTYECFGVFRGDKISALCIAVNVTEKVAYYYLPGTSPMFRNQSPMVLLIAGMVDHYRSKNFDILDLGVSSIEGNPQETLKLFKERMGAEETSKSAYLKLI